MFFHFRSHAIITCALALLLTLLCATQVRAQGDEDFGDDAAEPVQLFKRAQDAHGRGEYERALSLYDAAIKVRPEFPEAFYQRGTALVSLGRYAEAEKSFQKAMELRRDWSYPQAALGSLLLRLNRLDEAAKYLEGALALDQSNPIALVSMANLRLRNKAGRQALEDILEKVRGATSSEDGTALLWITRATLERTLSRTTDAWKSINKALALDPKSVSALMERAEQESAARDFDNAVKDAQAARQLAPQSLDAALFLAQTLGRAERTSEALEVIDALDEEEKRLPEVVALRQSLAASAFSETEDRAALEKLLEEKPQSAPLLARLCVLYRADDPTRALEYCRRALEIEPTNADYATGYGAALVRAKQYETAVSLLRKVIESEPNNYAAHANLATALYELKRYQEALVEYDWIIKTKPEIVVAYFFIATAHDQLGQFQEALAAYEKFLERADPKTNQLEIDKVKLRLPSLRNQLKRGEGAKNRTRKS